MAKKDRFAPILFKPEHPHVCPEAISYFDHILRPSFRVFEFGSGNSTIWFAKRVRSIIAVESRDGWGHLIVQRAMELGLENLTVLLRPVERGSLESSTRYAQSILDYPEGHFQLVFVDGLVRIECVENAFSKVGDGGYLVVDEVRRKNLPLRSLTRILKDWPFEIVTGRKRFSVEGDPLDTNTTFFRKVV